MSEPSSQNLSDDVLKMLRRHNLLKILLHHEITESAVATIELTEELKTQIWNNYKAKNNIQTEEELVKHAKMLGLDQESLHWQLELPERIKHYCRANFLHKAEARFLQKKESLDTVVYSLLRLKDGFLARELYLRILGKEANFSDLASEFSQGPEANTNGVVGPTSLKNAHPVLMEKLRTSRPGELLEPFCIDEWWLIARVERYHSSKFEEHTAEAIAYELFQEWIEEAVLCKMGEL